MFKFRTGFALAILMVLLFCVEIDCYASNSTSYVWSPIEQAAPTASVINSNESGIEDNFLNLESGAAILVEQSTGKILYSHNIHEQLRPASVTKVMSILLIMKQLESGKLQLTDQIPCSEKAASMGGSQIWLDTTETLSVDEMLKAICVRICK